MTAFPHLRGHSFMSLTTFRKTGVPVATPVWFAQEGDTLYVTTEPEAGKVKRIRHTPRVVVAPCTASGKILGETAEGEARLLSGNEAEHANRALNSKYGIQKRLFDLMGKMRRSQRVYLAIRSLG